MKKLLFVLAIICLIIPSCKKTPVIVLSVDKSEISANGEDLAEFKIICNGEDDVTKECHIFFSDSKKELGSVTFSTTEAKTYSFYATYKDATSNSVTVKANEVVIEEEEEEEEEEEKESPIILSVSANSIVANGIDIVEFTVRQDDADITAETEIFINDNKIEGNKFSTTTAGSYKAYAKKGELKSNEISITATAVPEPEKPITLSSSKTTIQANGVDIVTFTVKQYNKVVTNSSTFFVYGNKINGNQFTTTVAGSHTAYAKKNDIVSNEITIVAEAVEGGKTIVFAEGVSLTDGWYDVNKLTKNGDDIQMCWAASSANIIQWW